MNNEGLKQPCAPGKASGTDETGSSIDFIGYSAGHKGIVNCRP